jgi:hypothetical protein
MLSVTRKPFILNVVMLNVVASHSKFWLENIVLKTMPPIWNGLAYQNLQVEKVYDAGPSFISNHGKIYNGGERDVRDWR